MMVVNTISGTLVTYPFAAFRIGHATSPDGITWTKDPLNPVLIMDPVILGDGIGPISRR